MLIWFTRNFFVLRVLVWLLFIFYWNIKSWNKISCSFLSHSFFYIMDLHDIRETYSSWKKWHLENVCVQQISLRTISKPYVDMRTIRSVYKIGNIGVFMDFLQPICCSIWGLITTRTDVNMQTAELFHLSQSKKN